MTTGMRTEPTVEPRRRRNWNWLWLVLGLIIACALIGYATTPKPGHTGSNATSGSVQNGATGSQGAVGNFREQVIPNQTKNGSSNAPMNEVPSSVSRAKGQGVPAAESTGGTDAGAGVSGITSTQEGLGGATPRGNKTGTPDASKSTTDTNGPSHP